MAKKVQLTDNGVDIYPVTTSDVVAGLANVARTGSYNDLSDRPVVHCVPSGGTSGQVLKKASGTDYDVAWADEGGSGLFKVTPSETPFQDIWDAYEAGKLCVIDNGYNEQYLLGAIDEGRAYFYQVYEEGFVYWIQVDENDEWTDGDYPADNIFWATYGSTTITELSEQYEGGKLICIRHNGGLYTLSSLSEEDGEAHFYSPAGSTIFGIELYNENHWREYSSALEVRTNKVSSWSATPDHSHYPSEKLVKDSLDAKYEKPANGIPETDLASAVTAKLNATEIFWATYGTTTRAEVISALESGKIICVYYNNEVFVSAFVNSATGNTNNFYFSCLDNGQLKSVYIQSNGTWGGPIGFNAENASNRTSDIASNKTSTSKYPNTKAVADYAQPIIDANNKLDYAYLDNTPVIPEAVVAQELSIDSTPTANSANLVTSGGVASAIAAKYTKPAGGIPAGDIASGVIPDAVSANPTVPAGTTPTSLTGLQIGTSYYSISAGGGAVTDVTVGGTSVVSNGVAVVPAIPTVESLTTAEIDTIWTNAS